MTHKVNEYISEHIAQDDTAVSHYVAAARDNTEQKPLRLADVTTSSEKRHRLKFYTLLLNPPDVHSNHLC